MKYNQKLNMKYLKAMRYMNDLSQSDIDKKLNEYHGYWNKKEQGIVRINIDEFIDLCNIMELTNDDVLKLLNRDPGDTHNDTNNSRKDQD